MNSYVKSHMVENCQRNHAYIHVGVAPLIKVDEEHDHGCHDTPTTVSPRTATANRISTWLFQRQRDRGPPALGLCPRLAVGLMVAMSSFKNRQAAIADTTVPDNVARKS